MTYMKIAGRSVAALLIVGGVIALVQVLALGLSETIEIWLK